jgi:rhomboid family GlyGly-CTERM serine protease
LTRRLDSRWPFITLTLSAAMLLIYVAAPETSARFDLLVLDRSQSTRWWPWLSAHLLHTDRAHLGWNLLTFLCLGWLGEPTNRMRYALAIGIGIIAVDAWFAWINADLRYYCGLSGVLVTILLATLYGLRDRIPTRWLVAFAALVLLKTGWEWHSGVALLTRTQWPPAAGAHVAGYAAGVALVAAYAWRDRAARL